MRYETRVFAQADMFEPLKLKQGQVLLKLKSSDGHISDAAAITPWGGYVLSPYIVLQLPNKQLRWIVNPWKFLRKALRLTTLPVPDTTTENGRRLMLAHVDGDGFVSRAEWLQGTFAGDVMLKDILKKYQIPTTVSVIQGEIAANGLYPKKHKVYEQTARDIFVLPWVEIATHTYSHPYNWRAVEKRPKNKKLYLPIKNYKFNFKTEIDGSVDYINKNLAPKGKSCRVILWSGGM